MIWKITQQASNNKNYHRVWILKSSSWHNIHDCPAYECLQVALPLCVVRFFNWLIYLPIQISRVGCYLFNENSYCQCAFFHERSAAPVQVSSRGPSCATARHIYDAFWLSLLEFWRVKCWLRKLHGRGYTLPLGTIKINDCKHVYYVASKNISIFCLILFVAYVKSAEIITAKR